MRFFIQILIFFVASFSVSAQQDSDPEVLIGKAQALTDTDPNQALKIGEHLLKSVNSDQDRCDIQYIFAESWLNKGQFGNALTAAFKAKNLADLIKSKERQAQISIFIADILRLLQLDDQSEIYLKIAERNLNTGDSDVNTVNAIRFYNSKTLLALNSENFNLAQKQNSEAEKQLKKVNTSKNTNASAEYYLTHGRIFAFEKQTDSAQACFLKALKILRIKKNSVLFAIAADELSSVYFLRKQHQESVDLLLEALPIAGRLQHFPLQRSINKKLAVNYLALKNRERYHFYNQKFLEVSDVVDNLENESTNVAFNLISREQENTVSFKESQYLQYLYLAIAATIITFICFVIFVLRNKSRVERYQEIKNYLEIGLKTSRPNASEIKKEPSKNLVIPIETEQNILSKLRKFESSTRFTNKEMSLAVLAAQFDTNTKYLSEIINKHNNDNFNTYINKLRIAYIIDKIKTEPHYRNYKISYLADESGFSSHSSFATIFKSITGIAPTTFIDFVKEETKLNQDQS